MLPLGAEDLELLATSAYMLGRDDDVLSALERAHHAYVGSGDAPRAVRCGFWLGINLVMGFAGNDLYRWTLARRGFGEIGLAAGSDLDEAELRFFSALPETPAAAPAPVLRQLPPSMPDALGLFPQPGGAR